MECTPNSNSGHDPHRATEQIFAFKDDRTAEIFLKALKSGAAISGFPGRCVCEHVTENHHFDCKDLRLASQGSEILIRLHPGNPDLSLYVRKRIIGKGGRPLFLTSDPVALTEEEYCALQEGRLSNAVAHLIPGWPIEGKIQRILVVLVQTIVFDLLGNSVPEASIEVDLISVLDPLSREPKPLGYEIKLISTHLESHGYLELEDFILNGLNAVPIFNTRPWRLARLNGSEDRDTAPRKVILDMDPGVDDALALMLAICSPEIEVTGITTSSGNVTAAQAAKNCASVLGVMSSSLGPANFIPPPLAEGLPPQDSRIDASHVHGFDGLSGQSHRYRDIRVPIDPDAAMLFERLVSKHPPGSVTLVVTGPMTNLAHWIDQFPEAVSRLQEIVCMGGAFFLPGNISPAAEFNIHKAPEEARKVLAFCNNRVSGQDRLHGQQIPLSFIGLDVTRNARLYNHEIHQDRDNTPTSQVSAFIRDISSSYMDFTFETHGFHGLIQHDALAVACVVDPSLAQFEEYHMEVEDKGRFTSGMSLVDRRMNRIQDNPSRQTAWVCYKFDTYRFGRMFAARVLGQ